MSAGDPSGISRHPAKCSAITGARTRVDAIKLKLLINIGLFLLDLQTISRML